MLDKKMNPLKLNSEKSGFLAISLFILISFVNVQPGSFVLYCFILLAGIRGKIDFDTEFNNQKLFPTLVTFSLCLFMSIGLLNKIYWGLGEITLISFSIPILTHSFKKDNT